jgi:hypothetical protein
MNKLIGRAALRSLFLLALTVVPATLRAQAPPTVRDFVSFLDERCYQISGPSLGVPLLLTHLNPVFQDLPNQNVLLGPPQQVCVPVQKDELVPPKDVLPYLQYVDWACFEISGPPLNVTVKIDQLNPVIAKLLGPTDIVTVLNPQQLCVPVSKNNEVLPADVQNLVQYLDVECFQVTAAKPVGGQILKLTHLNPLLTSLPLEVVTFNGPTATQLCTPVAKNNQIPPDDVLPYIQYSDVLCYEVTGPAINRDLRLTHLNPVLSGLPQMNVVATTTQKLCVPVAKNHQFPPG